jgi:polar amino acid transport system substrate-binding protein
MRWAKLIASTVLLTLFGLSGLADARTLTVAADLWCPFNCSPDSVKPGYMVELLGAILIPQGYKLNYKVMPWTRAVMEAQAGQIDGVIAAGEEDAAKLVLHKLPFGKSSQVFVVRQGEEFEWRNADSIGNRRLQIIAAYDYGADVMRWIDRHPKQIEVAFGETPLQNSLRKLAFKRTDVVVNNEAVMHYTLRDMDMPEHFTIRPTGQQVPLFIGLSPKLNDVQQLADMIDQGIVRLRRSGELKRILDRYGLADWN